MKITTASVKVMRSFDYCHFEIILGVIEPDGFGEDGDSIIDDLRKRAARMADKAVEQYKVAKTQSQLKLDVLSSHNYMRQNAEEIERLGEMDRTPRQQAELKAWKDLQFRANREYDYQDDWDEGN